MIHTRGRSALGVRDTTKHHTPGVAPGLEAVARRTGRDVSSVARPAAQPRPPTRVATNPWANGNGSVGRK
jgi:hypothetical protein